MCLRADVMVSARIIQMKDHATSLNFSSFLISFISAKHHTISIKSAQNNRQWQNQSAHSKQIWVFDSVGKLKECSLTKNINGYSVKQEN